MVGEASRRQLGFGNLLPIESGALRLGYIATLFWELVGLESTNLFLGLEHITFLMFKRTSR